MDNFKPQNAVAAIRVSTVRQGTEGDSPDAQKEQIEQFARNRGITVKKLFLFLESASKEQQPMQEAIDYCKNPKHGIQLFIVKSIDRFTRGGSYSYSNLKMQLEASGVRLVDLYGIIGTQKVNTLEHLGVSYDWSVYDPTKNSELLEAERAKDEKRDIMSRMIGAEIRYTRLGYWNRRPLYGYVNEKVTTINGRRCVLMPHPIEAMFVAKMFELRCRNTLSDKQIVRMLNKLGFRTRIMYRRSRTDKAKIIGKIGGSKLSVKQLQLMVTNPLYAGINCEVWTGNAPTRMKSAGIVSIDVFNQANRGKITIREELGVVNVYRRKATTSQTFVRKGANNSDYPYKRVVMCPYCRRPAFGSASRGRSGTLYPAYHCDRNDDHYFRVRTVIFHQAMDNFLNVIRVKPDYVNQIVAVILQEWHVRQEALQRDDVMRAKYVNELQHQVDLMINNLKYLRHETTLSRIEEDITELESRIKTTQAEGSKVSTDEIADLKKVEQYARECLLNLPNLLMENTDAETKGIRFGVLFDRPPTYEEIQTFDAKEWSQNNISLNQIFCIVSQ